MSPEASRPHINPYAAGNTDMLASTVFDLSNTQASIPNLTPET